MLFPDAFERGACGRERSEIEAHVRARPCYRRPEGTERDDDIGNERGVTVGGKPPQISNGGDGPVAQNSGCLGGFDRSPVNCVLAFRSRLQAERGPESFRS